MSIASINPLNGEVLERFDALSPADIEARLARAAEAFQAHRATPLDKRIAWLREAARLLEAEKEALGRMMTLEMGKPLRSAISEVEKCARLCRFYADEGPSMLADHPVKTDAEASWVAYQPLGVVLAVMPWNFPFWQVFRFAAPALLAGNVGLLKHASNVPRCALAIEDLLRRAGFTANAFQTLLIGSDQVKRVLEDRRVAAATLTGSEGAGRSVGEIAGRHLKKVVLELGGSDPFIVMPSADVEQAAEVAVKARLINNGQSCIAAKRFIVHAEVYDAFKTRFLEKMRALVMGDPLDAGTDLGPLATHQLRDDVHQQVVESVKAGARCLLGGEVPDGPGAFYPATVLEAPPRGSPAYSDEVFGPVAGLFRVENLDAAIALANDSPFGLGASAWTRDPDEQRRFVAELATGSVFLNGMVQSDPRVPFGGIKNSGHGRELSDVGLREFLNLKTVWIAEDARIAAGERRR